jgi:uncharacterized membrane protein SirB2
MDYIALKHFHITCVALSGGLFILRGIWMMQESIQLQQRWVKVAPHLIDTLLLVSAIMLAIWSHQYPFVQGWLTAKVLGLLVYIVLGTIALKRSKSKRVRIAAFCAALAVFLYIISVAVTKHPFVLL